MNTIPKEKIAELKAYPFRYRLRMLRGWLGYNQKEFASLLGHHQATISLWERGVIQPSSKNMMKMIQVFDLPCDFFVDVESMNSQGKKD